MIIRSTVLALSLFLPLSAFSFNIPIIRSAIQILDIPIAPPNSTFFWKISCNVTVTGRSPGWINVLPKAWGSSGNMIDNFSRFSGKTMGNKLVWSDGTFDETVDYAQTTGLGRLEVYQVYALEFQFVSSPYNNIFVLNYCEATKD